MRCLVRAFSCLEEVLRSTSSPPAFAWRPSPRPLCQKPQRAPWAPLPRVGLEQLRGRVVLLPADERARAGGDRDGLAARVQQARETSHRVLGAVGAALCAWMIVVSFVAPIDWEILDGLSVVSATNAPAWAGSGQGPKGAWHTPLPKPEARSALCQRFEHLLGGLSVLLEQEGQLAEGSLGADGAGATIHGSSDQLLERMVDDAIAISSSSAWTSRIWSALRTDRGPEARLGGLLLIVPGLEHRGAHALRGSIPCRQTRIVDELDALEKRARLGAVAKMKW